MKAIIFFILGLICMGFIFFDVFTFAQYNANRILSSSSILINICLTFVCIIHMILSITHTHKFRLPIGQLILLPSVLLPILLLLLYSVPIFWSVLDKKFVFDLAQKDYMDSTIMLIFVSSLLLLIGIYIGKYWILRNKRCYMKRLNRKLDIFNNKYIKTYILFLTILSIILFPFEIGLRFDVIFEGGRGFNVNSNFLSTLIPFAGIFSIILTIAAGFLYSKSNNMATFWIPIINMFPKIIILSRAFFLPLILFIFSSSLLGKKYPIWLFLSLPIGSIFLSVVALFSRGLSSGGLSGLASGFHLLQDDIFSLVRDFFHTNTNIGILSNSVAFHDSSKDFIDGFIAWINTVSPIPNAISNVKENIPDVAELLGATSLGIPMPVLGELYFQMGWIGIIIFLLLGIWVGRLEGNIILHSNFYGSAYWTNVLLWLSIFYGFILSFHSATRASFRVLLYSLGLIWLLSIILSFENKKKW
ncbi:MAG: hypothetical protein MJK14_07150 [Rivularia sp. ALOHA_DT_140]|nr:hypothetical protein [Rivularia sp. ALOHA_DT_140]